MAIPSWLQVVAAHTGDDPNTVIKDLSPYAVSVPGDSEGGVNLDPALELMSADEVPVVLGVRSGLQGDLDTPQDLIDRGNDLANGEDDYAMAA